jgi:subtilase family protein
MRSNNSNSNSPAKRSNVLARLPLALTAMVAVCALATAAHAQRLPSLGSSGTGPVGGSSGITGTPTGKPGKGTVTRIPGTTNPGKGTITRVPGISIANPGIITGNPGNTGRPGKPGKGGGTTVGDGGRPQGGNPGHDRPHKPPRWKPPIYVTVPVVTAVTAATPAIGAGNPKIVRKGGGGSPQLSNPSGPSTNAQSLRRNSGVPPANERRYVPDEVLVQLLSSMPDATIDALAQRMRLNRIESYTSNGVTMFLWKILDGRSVSAVIRSLEAEGVRALPNYLYTQLQQQSSLDKRPAAPGTEGELEQYALAKLQLPQAHALAKGEKVLVAVIDSGIDTTHPELAGMVVDSFDALKSDEKAHPHGTAIAGAIVARAKLMGTAPDARILAARAFSAKKTAAEATTYSIVQSIDWAISRGANVINMSFTGPRDPSIEERIGQARKKGIILIAAAGNGGPTAPQAFPAAYPNVIAVTATDADDQLFKGANRGGYIAVAAPGVDLLLPTLEAGYQMTTGTSFAAAEVSGIVALMLERKPDLNHDGVRKALTATARDLGPKGFDTQFGAGLVDAYRAIRSLEPAIATTGARVLPAKSSVTD